MNYFCCDQERRDEVRRASEADDAAMNGIDYIEVVDADAPAPAPGEKSWRQRILRVHFIHAGHLAELKPTNFQIEGDADAPPVLVEALAPQDAESPEVCELHLDRPGNFSTYSLRLVTNPTQPDPPEDFDPILSSLEFSFKVECPTPFDCAAPHACAPPGPEEPELDYLARDYASFRRLMLDRLAVLLPRWRDRSPADMGNVLIEALAYAGDHLSYQQDAIATEAYLGTARRRESVRRHARLVDYVMHEGCNARAWIAVRVTGSDVLLEAHTPLFAGLNRLASRIGRSAAPSARELLTNTVAFETVADGRLFEAHNSMRFYTWSDRRCCLPKGATRATLMDGKEEGERLRLCAGDVLVLEETLGDVTKRHAVRLTRVNPAADRETRVPGGLRTDPLTSQAIVDIEWHELDALPFPLCVSGKDGETGSVHGNIVCADHGLTIDEEALGSAPDASIYLAPGRVGQCETYEPVAIPARFNPRLSRGPLTHAAGYDATSPASAALETVPAQALPSITLTSGTDREPWNPQRDLLSSHGNDTHFVVELDNSGIAHLRFGNGSQGRRAPVGKPFSARYRVGNGAAGNVGADSITHVIHDDPRILAVSNPLAARGGAEPESLEDVRQRAPSAFRRQERAVTESDYAILAEQESGVQRAAATFRWTGSWHTAFVTVDRSAGSGVSDDFEASMRRRLERYRLVGQDLEVDSPRFVSLEIEMHVCVKPDHFRSQVRAALLQVFSSGVSADGRRGYFHPDNFTFGQPVYLGPLYAAAQRVPGVASVHITTFRRQGILDPRPLQDGVLTLGRLEIVRLESNPDFPERGVFQLDLGGGK